MREFGVVLAVAASGNVTVRAAGRSFPSEGHMVFDRTGRNLGRVARVFGPVAQPYLSVRPLRPPTISEAAAWIGAAVLDEGG